MTYDNENDDEIKNEHVDQLVDGYYRPSEYVFSDYVDDVVAAGERIQSGYQLISTGWEDNGEKVDLTFPRRALTLFAAKTGGGKTTSLLNMAMRMARSGKKGIFITLEEPAYKLAVKSMAIYDHMHRPDGEGKNVTVKGITRLMRARKIHEWKYLGAYKTNIADNLKFVDANADMKSDNPAKPTYLYDANFMDWFCDRSPVKLDFIIVDYIQLMKSEDADGKQGYLQMKAVMQAVRFMCGQHDAAIIMGAQLNREVKGLDFMEWTPEHLREAADIEQGANQIFAVSPMKVDIGPPVFGIRCLKNRDENREIEGYFNINFGQQVIDADEGVLGIIEDL